MIAELLMLILPPVVLFSCIIIYLSTIKHTEMNSEKIQKADTFVLETLFPDGYYWFGGWHVHDTPAGRVYHARWTPYFNRAVLLPDKKAAENERKLVKGAAPEIVPYNLAHSTETRIFLEADNACLIRTKYLQVHDIVEYKGVKREVMDIRKGEGENEQFALFSVRIEPYHGSPVFLGKKSSEYIKLLYNKKQVNDHNEAIKRINESKLN